jgi:hypothetical protein
MDVIDILANVSEKLRSAQDFQVYYTQQANIAAGRPLEPARTLDKFKFLPMHDDVYVRYPKAKFYISLEADTFVLLPNLLRYLTNLDPKAQILLGCGVGFGDSMFPHGGSGYVMSNGLMDASFGQHRDQVLHSMDDFTDGHCCGDLLLAAAVS